MQEQLIEFKTALLLKEKGFILPTYFAYVSTENNLQSVGTKQSSFHRKEYGDTHPIDWNNTYKGKYYDCVSAPSKSSLQAWFRDVHGIQINVNHYSVDGDIEQVKDEFWHYVVEVSRQPESKTHDLFVKSGFLTYEEALETALFEALSFI